MQLRSVILLSFLVAASGSAAAAADDKVDAEGLYKSTCMPCHMADGNAAMSYADREFAGGNAVVADQGGLYWARGLIPEDASYSVSVGTPVATPEA